MWEMLAGQAAGALAQGSVGLAGMLGAFNEDVNGRDRTADLGYNQYFAQRSLTPSLAQIALAQTPWWQSLGSQTFQRALQGGAAQQVTGMGYDPLSDSYQPYSFWMPETTGALQTYQQALPTLMNANMATARGGMPETYGLLGQAGSMYGNVANAANREMSYGAALSPSIRREIIQASMSNPALSSFGAQPRDAYMAYANLGTAADARQRQRWGDVNTAAGNLSGLAGTYGNLAAPALSQTYNLGGNLLASGLNANMQSNPGWYDPFSNTTGALNQASAQMNFQQGLINQAIKVGGAKQMANSFSSMGNALGNYFGGAGGAGGGSSGGGGGGAGYGDTLYNMYYGGGG